MSDSTTAPEGRRCPECKEVPVLAAVLCTNGDCGKFMVAAPTPAPVGGEEAEPYLRCDHCGRTKSLDSHGAYLGESCYHCGAGSFRLVLPGDPTPTSAEGGEARCKCGDPACTLWREDEVCPHCSARFAALNADPEYEGRGGDGGEGHYGECAHGERPTPTSAEGGEARALVEIHRVCNHLTVSISEDGTTRWCERCGREVEGVPNV